MLVSTGAVVVNLQVYTTQANQQPAIRLLQEVVNNGSIISVRGLITPCVGEPHLATPPRSLCCSRMASSAIVCPVVATQ